MGKTRVKVVAVLEKKDTPCWPCINHDAGKELKRIMDPVCAHNPDMDFDVVPYTELSEAQADYESDLKKYDGVLVLLFTCWKGIDLFYARQSRDGIPTIIADVPFCGTGSALCVSAPAIRDEKLPVPLLATLDYTEIARNVRIFDALKKLKQATILVIANNEPVTKAAFESEWGLRIVMKSSDDLHRYMTEVDGGEARAVADRWISEAVEIREADDGDILEGAVIHLALKAMMKDVGADAVTVDCLELSYSDSYVGGKRFYPCLSHFEMLNNGEIGVCEADLGATVTSLAVLYLTGRPGYVSDPVIDTSSGQIIYAHCVGCRKVFGRDDPRTCQYAIRSHAEDKKGASVQIIFPLGEQTTTMMINASPLPSLIHSGEAVGNVGLQEACRSKLAVKTNVRAILNNSIGIWHHVTVYGEWRELFMNFMKAKGLDVIEEDKD